MHHWCSYCMNCAEVLGDARARTLARTHGARARTDGARTRGTDAWTHGARGTDARMYKTDARGDAWILACFRG